MAESEPYSSDLDARIPVGAVVPGSLILAGIWPNGRT